jgi:uncharacterized protein
MAEDRYERLVEEFLACERVAVWGVEDARTDPGGWIVRRLRKRGMQVIEVNPKFTDSPARQRASSLTKVGPPVQAVLIYVDRPQALEATGDCLAAQVPLVWLHDALSPGSATSEVIGQLRSAGCRVIPGLCPMLFLKPVDPAHFCLKWVLRLTGKERRVRRQAV